METRYCIRDAVRGDLDTLIAFTLQEAREAERLDLDADAVRRGVRTGLEAPGLARYWVAESPEDDIVGSISVVREWSNFHGGHYWWIQSLFIVPEHRGRGLLERLLDHVAEAAKAGGALDLRLYAHKSNLRALRAYRRCGFGEAPYAIMTRRLRGGGPR